MLKCASKCLIATFQKGLLRGNAELSKKAVETRKRNSVLKLTPCLVVRFTRYYGFCTGNSGKFSNEKKQGKGPKEKKNSILDDFKNNVFDALRWTGVAAIGYYILQPLKQNCLTKNHFENDNRTLSSYEITINYLAHSLGLQPYNTILPVQKTSQSKQSKESDCGESSAEDSELDEEEDLFEKAHHKVLGMLSNWLGTQYMQSGNYKEAMEFFMQSADKENAAGIFNLGICHERGLGTSQDFKRAAELYQKATDLGHPTAMYNLGVFYARGLGGVEPDVDRARDLFKRAARLGQKDAEQALILEEESREEISYKKEADESIIDNFSAAFSTGNLLESFNLRGKKDKRPEPDLLWNEGDSLNDSKSSLDNDSGVLDMSPQTEADDFFARLL